MRTALTLLVTFALVRSAGAHPAPFTYLDARLGANAIELTLVVHIFDVAHDLGVDPPERLLEPAFLSLRSQDIVAMLTPRVTLGSERQGGVPLQWSDVEALPERQSIQLHARVPVAGMPSITSIDALLFPYDIAHQTFINVYERDSLALQAILDRSKTHLDFYSGTRGGTTAVLRRFVVEGLRHVVLGPEHLVFLAGLVLLGGTGRRLALIVIAFAGAHALTLTLGALNVLQSPARLIEPGLALSIVYLGADNLMVRGGRDVRLWIASAFGALHGLGFANSLRTLDLSQGSLRWSLLGFNVGLSTAQALIVLIAGTAVTAIRSRHEIAGRRLVYAGSLGIIAAGTLWFVQRVFFPGGFA